MKTTTNEIIAWLDSTGSICGFSSALHQLLQTTDDPAGTEKQFTSFIKRLELQLKSTHEFVLKIGENCLSWNFINSQLTGNPEQQSILLGKIIIENKEDRLLQSVLDHIPYKIFWKDENSIFLGCNMKFAKSAGINSVHDLVGKTDFDMPWRKHAPKYVADDKQVLYGGNSKLEYEEYHSRNGRQQIVLTSKVHLPLAKSPAVLGIFQDITERKTKEKELYIAKRKAELANNYKSDFMSMISHELRTPLNTIQGCIDLMAADNLSGQTEDMVNILREAIHQLVSIIDESIDMDKTTFSFKPIDFNLLKSLEYFRHFPIPEDKQHLKVTFDFDPQLDVNISADEVRLKQIISNLFDNAIKYTDDGKIALEAKLVGQSKNDIQLYFKITDSGCGIAPENQYIIFDKYTQIKSGPKNYHKGCGLGLTICNDLIRRMHGHLEVESVLNEGSAFSFLVKIPRCTADIERYHQAELQSDSSILVVEDNKINQVVMRKMLEKLQLSVDIASSAHQTMEILQAKKYDLILMDIGLPDMDGHTLAKWIKKLNPEQRIVAATAHYGYETHDQVFEETLIKPISLDDLRSVV